MVNEMIIQNFLHDLGTLTCGESDAIAYFTNSGEQPAECLAALCAIPNILLSTIRFGKTNVHFYINFNTSMKTILIIIGVVIFIVAALLFSLHQMKNAQELPPDDSNF